MGRETASTKPDLEIVIQNVVASASLDQQLDLQAIMKIFRNVEYRPKQFPGLVFSSNAPRRLLSYSTRETWYVLGLNLRNWPERLSIKLYVS